MSSCCGWEGFTFPITGAGWAAEDPRIQGTKELCLAVGTRYKGGELPEASFIQGHTLESQVTSHSGAGGPR